MEGHQRNHVRVAALLEGINLAKKVQTGKWTPIVAHGAQFMLPTAAHELEIEETQPFDLELQLLFWSTVLT